MRAQLRISSVALVVCTFCVVYASGADADIGESREDPLIAALKNNKPPLWSEGATKAAAIMEKERQCILIEYLKFDKEGSPDIQANDQGTPLFYDAKRHLVDLTTVPVDRQGKALIYDKGDTLIEITKLPSARLKQDLAIQLAVAKDNELNTEARKQLNLAVYGPNCANGPKTPSDVKKGGERSQAAIDELTKYANANRLRKMLQKWRQDSEKQSHLPTMSSASFQ